MVLISLINKQCEPLRKHAFQCVALAEEMIKDVYSPQLAKIGGNRMTAAVYRSFIEAFVVFLRHAGRPLRWWHMFVTPFPMSDPYLDLMRSVTDFFFFGGLSPTKAKEVVRCLQKMRDPALRRHIEEIQAILEKPVREWAICGTTTTH